MHCGDKFTIMVVQDSESELGTDSKSKSKSLLKNGAGITNTDNGNNENLSGKDCVF